MVLAVQYLVFLVKRVISSVDTVQYSYGHGLASKALVGGWVSSLIVG